MIKETQMISGTLEIIGIDVEKAAQEGWSVQENSLHTYPSPEGGLGIVVVEREVPYETRILCHTSEIVQKELNQLTDFGWEAVPESLRYQAFLRDTAPKFEDYMAVVIRRRRVED